MRQSLALRQPDRHLYSSGSRIYPEESERHGGHRHHDERLGEDSDGERITRSQKSHRSGNCSARGYSSNKFMGGDASGPTKAKTNNLIAGNPGVLGLLQKSRLAPRNDLSVTIDLAEPAVFVPAFKSSEKLPNKDAVLRGILRLRVQMMTEIKAISLEFHGNAVTKHGKLNLINHTWSFFKTWPKIIKERGIAGQAQSGKRSDSTSTDIAEIVNLRRPNPNAVALNLTTREAERHSPRKNPFPAHDRTDAFAEVTIPAKNRYSFPPGEYSYNFEIPIDSNLPATIDLGYASIKYELKAVIERRGVFRAKLTNDKQVTIISVPAENSFEQVEPIAFTRNWKNDLQYQIIISGKSFPLGTQIPVAVKLVPEPNVQFHGMTVFITENLEYPPFMMRVHSLEPPREIKLFEGRADGIFTNVFPRSTKCAKPGDDFHYYRRPAAVGSADCVRKNTGGLCGAVNDQQTPVVEPTEMEFDVQLPSCHDMEDEKRTHRLHIDAACRSFKVHHWIKV